jgi:predicted  nucleic acid-binding Zn-ribbon protein
MKKLPLLLVLLLVLSGDLLRAADAQDPVLTRMREALKNTMIQLRDAQTQVATLQATQAQNEAKIKDLQSQLDKITKQASDDKLAADKTIADLKEQNAAQDARNAKELETIAKWKKSYDALLAQAKAIDARRAEFAGKCIQLQRQVDDQQRKNLAMYDLGMEILKRYERFGLGEALTAREPFTGLTRVKFQNLIQDYGDKLADQKIKQ